MTAFAEVNYGSSETNAPFEGHPFQSTQPGSLFGGGPGLTGLQPSIPVTSPFVPQALRNLVPAFTGTGADTRVINWQQRFGSPAGFAERGASNDRENSRLVVGFRGDIPTLGFGSDWTWEASHVYGRSLLQSQTNGLVATDRLYYGLRVEQTPGAAAGTYRCVDAGARASGCVPINPFAPLTPAMVNYLSATAGQRGVGVLEDTTAFISGSPFELPAGPLQMVLGVERRSFAGYLDYDELINRALVTGNQIGDVSRAAVVVKEAFTEVVAPILKDKPWVNSLEFNGAFRYSKPQGDRDDYQTWSYGLNWSPIDSVRLRAMKSRAVRSPTPDDLSGVGQTFGVVNDPCT
ncbi:MAG: hypothetical protein EOP08_16615, partial [Proteobacteria bacterium]